MGLLAGSAPVCSRLAPKTLRSHPKRYCLLGQESSGHSFLLSATYTYVTILKSIIVSKEFQSNVRLVGQN